jgi:ribonuclease HII
LGNPLKPYYKKDLIEAGCDEAGRGCLAGHVFAAAVILPKDYINPLLNDSKKLSEKIREKLRFEIEKEAISFSVGIVENETIDKINILQSSFLAMHRAIDGLSQIPEFLIIDGNRFLKYKDIPHKCIIKGDGKYLSIAAASVLAKTYRDSFMKKIDLEFPQYFWSKNKGYPTKQHRLAIQENGITKYHRKSFKLLETQLEFDFGK